MAVRSIRAFHEHVAYTTQTFDQRRGFNVVRFITGLIVVAIAGTAAVVFTPLSETARLLALRGSPLEQQSLATVAPGETAEYSVRFRNTGLVTWQRGTTDVVLAVKNDSVEFAGAGLAIDWLSANRIAATLEPTVAPGAVGTFAFKLRAPAATGVYRIPVGLVSDGEKWLSEDAVVVLASDHGFHSELVDQTQHPNLRPGESGTLTVRVANTGTRTWSRGLLKQQVNLGLDGDDRTASALGLGWPSADRVAIQNEPAVAPGAIASFTFRVRAPSAPGMYPLRLRPVVDGVTWMEPSVLSLISVGSPTRLSEASSATTTTSSKQPSFAMGVAADRTGVVPGQAVNLVASYTSDSPTRAFVGVEILAPIGGVISYGKWWEREYFEAGELRAFPVTWQIPASAMTGPYTVRLRAFGLGWKPLFGFDDAAATINVAPPPVDNPPPPSPSAPATTTPPSSTGTPSPTVAPPTATPAPTAAPSFGSSATVAPASLGTGNTVTINASVTSATTTTALVSVGVYPPGGALAVSQESFDSQSFVAGQARSYPVNWTVPADAVAGTYRVSLGVFSPGWGTQYSWVDSAATFEVTVAGLPTPTAAPATPTPTPVPSATGVPAPSATSAPSPSPSAPPTVVATPSPSPTATAAPSPSFTQTTTVSPTSAAPGGSVSITMTVTASTASTAIVSLNVYAPGGITQLDQQWFENQIFTAGQQRTYTVSWSVPSTAASGTYVVKAGVFPPGWAPKHYNWWDPIGSFNVTAPAPTPAPTAAPTAAPTPTPTTAPQLQSVNDTSFSYAGTWLTSTASPKYQGDDHYSSGTGSTYSITFNGTSLLLYAARAPYHGIAAVSVDGGPESDVDLYAAIRAEQALLFATPTLANGTHTVRVRVTGRKNSASTDFIVNADRADVAGTVTAPAPTPVPTVAPTSAPTTPPTFSGLHVEGNRLANAQGQTVVLRGINRMGMEYMCVQVGGLMDGPVDQASVNAMRSWRNVNAIRVPLNEHCWLGIGGTPRGATYQQGVENYVNLLTASGMYVILDLHWSAPPDRLATGQQAMPNTFHSADFWRSVASRFKNNPMVIFDLFNEPIPNNNANDSTDGVAMRMWSCWRDGGAGGNCDATLNSSVGTSLSGSQAVGMQALVDAVRSTGAQNVIAVSGIQWANTLWSNSARNFLTYKPYDPLGQLVASTHSYEGTWCLDTACWDREVAPVAAQMPVIFGEFGNKYADTNMLNSLMNWSDAHGVGYLAWTWSPASGGFSQHKLILSWDGTPNDYGQLVRSHLAILP
jgi:endoglucanase